MALCHVRPVEAHDSTADTPAGAIPRQIDVALASAGVARRRRSRRGSSSTTRAASSTRARCRSRDYDAIAARLAGFDHVVVESHPALVGERVDSLLRGARRSAPRGVALEVAMGLETAHPVGPGAASQGDDASSSSRRPRLELRRRGVARAGLPARPAALRRRGRAGAWLRRSIDFAFECGVIGRLAHAHAHRQRGARGAASSRGSFARPRLRDLERALALRCPSRAAASSPTSGTSSASPTARRASRRVANGCSA